MKGSDLPQVGNLEFVPATYGVGPARTPEGGIYINSSDLDLFRDCSQKYFNRRVLGLKKAGVTDYLEVGAAFGAGVQAWLSGLSNKEAQKRIRKEISDRNPGTLLPEEQELIDKIYVVACSWTERYAEWFVDPHRDFQVIASEWVASIQIGRHRYVMSADNVVADVSGMGFQETKTTKTKDMGKYLMIYQLNNQINGYSRTVERTLTRMPQTWLDICIKPGTQLPFGKGWARYRAAEPTFHREMLFPTAKQTLTWERHTQVTADRIAWLLDMDPKNEVGMWDMNTKSCLGLYQSQPCNFFAACVGHQKITDLELVPRETDYVNDPRLAMAGKKWAA